MLILASSLKSNRHRLTQLPPRLTHSTISFDYIDCLLNMATNCGPLPCTTLASHCHIRSDIIHTYNKQYAAKRLLVILAKIAQYCVWTRGPRTRIEIMFLWEFIARQKLSILSRKITDARRKVYREL